MLPDPPEMADKSQDPAPAPVMSAKSVLVTETVAASIVRLVPRARRLTSVCINKRFVML